MRTIGLTGGIGSGKSTVAAMLRDLGAHHIDADQIGHRAYAPGTAGWDEVVAAFGREIVAPDGTIDRKKLGPIVFADPAGLQRLNAILHPRMAAMIATELDDLRSAGAVEIAVVEAAILIEANWTPLVEEVWVTAVPEAIAAERLIARNGLTAEQAQQRIRAQLSNEERQKHAHRVIDTSGTLVEVRAQVEALWGERARTGPPAGSAR